MSPRLIAGLLFSAALFAQSADAQVVPGAGFEAVFVPYSNAETSSGASTALDQGGRCDVFQYSPPFFLSADKVITDSAFNCVLGDEDNDGVMFEEVFGGLDAIDVMSFPPPLFPNPFAPRTLYDYVYSSKKCTNGISRGSLFRLVPGGQGSDVMEVVLSKDQIRSSLGSCGNNCLDVDGFTQDTEGNIYLSFTKTVQISGSYLSDGGVVMISKDDLTYGNSEDTNRPFVFDVNPGSAIAILTEDMVETMVLGTGVPGEFKDLSGLSMDPNPGTFMGADGQLHQNLMFAEKYLGAAVFTTENGGQIANLNGIPLGTGKLTPLSLGLSELDGGLNALAIVPGAPRPTVIDAEDDVVDSELGEDLVAFTIGGCTPESLVLVAFALQEANPGYQATGAQLYGHNFPIFYPFPLTSNMVFFTQAGLDGRATIGQNVPASKIAKFSGTVLLAQPYDTGHFLMGTVPQLGAPGMVWFK